MKTAIVLICTLLVSIISTNVHSQVSTYTFSETTSTYQELTSGINIFSGNWDDPNPITVNLPFTFYFNNIGYNSVSVNPNGYITFGSIASANNGFLPISVNTAYDGVISALGMDLRNNTGTSTVSYNTIGSGNSRTFIIQWKNARRYAQPGAWNFQIRLSEGTNVIRIVYGSCAPEVNTNVNAQIGLRGFLNTDFNNRLLAGNELWAGKTSPGTASNSTVRTRSNAYPQNGLNFIYTPFVPAPATLDYVDGFETNPHNWVLINGIQTNKWFVGSEVNNGGSRSLYISNNPNGTTHNYVNTSSVVHAYRTISIPTGTNQVGIYFDWRAFGDENGDDYLRTWIVPSDFHPIPGQVITSGGGRIMLNEKLNRDNTWKTEYNENVNVSTFAGSTMKLVFEWVNNATTRNNSPAAIDNVRVLRYCTGSPNGGAATITPATGAPSSNFTINVTGNTIAAGIQYQWQIAETISGPWSNITGATTENLATTAVPFPSTTRFYRRKVVCTASNQESFSNVVSFTTTTPNYCQPTSQTPNGLYINSVSIVGAMIDPPVNNSTFGTNGYSNFTTLPLIAEQAQGEGITIGGSVFGELRYRGLWKAWIDWNGDGDFEDSGELIFTGTVYSKTADFGFIIPENKEPGLYRLRIRVNNGLIEPSTFDYNSCNNFAGLYPYGETEDYLFKVVPNCSAKITTVTSISECHAENGVEMELSASASQVVTEFRWYDAATGGNLVGTSSPDGTGMNTNWITPSLSQTTIYYVTAFNGTCESTFRIPVTAEVTPTPIVTFTPSNLEVCGESSIVAVSATGSNEVKHLIEKQTFEDGTLGVFHVHNITGNNATINNKVNWQSRNSVYIPQAPNYLSWYPAISSGFGGNKFLMATSDVNAGQTIDKALRSPINLDSRGLLNLTLKFRLFFSRYNDDGQFPDDEYVSVEISTTNSNNNSNWTVIDKITSDVGQGGKFAEKIYNLDAYIGIESLRIRFRYYAAGWYDGVAIDDIELFGERPLSPSFTWNSSSPIGVYENAEGTIEYTGGPISTVYIKPEQNQLETYESWNVVATATLQNGCNAQGTINIVNNTKLWDAASTNWTSNAWLPSIAPPTADQCVIIRKPVTIPTLNDAYAKNIKVESTGKIEVDTYASLTVTDEIINEGTPDSFVVKHNGNLLQTNPLAVNVGSIQVEKQFTFIDAPNPVDDRKQFNYVISPVVGQNMKNIYSDSFNAMVIEHREATNMYYNHNGSYLAGKGLSIKEPNKTQISTSSAIAKYKGIPFNGYLSYPLAYTTTNPDVSHGFNLIGNPYPSNLDIEALYFANSSIMESTFYFWDNRGNTLHVQQGSNYNGDHFAKYNALSDTGVGVGSAADGAEGEERIPNRYVKVGTAFLVRALPTANGQNIHFNNLFRSADNTGPGFFGKGGNFEQGNQNQKDRYWLRLTTPSNTEYMNAIVYFEGGNNGYGIDDTKTFGASNDIYSLVDNNELAIQGKGPFVTSDVVPLGIRLFETGKHTISILNKEGIFANDQKIYLRDKERNIIHDLTLEPYHFKSRAGQFNQRFEIIYTRMFISVSSHLSIKNDVEIKKQDGNIQITSTLDNIMNLEIFSINGNTLYKNLNFGAKEIKIPLSRFNNEIIIVNVVTDKGEKFSKKFIVN